MKVILAVGLFGLGLLVNWPVAMAFAAGLMIGLCWRDEPAGRSQRMLWD